VVIYLAFGPPFQPMIDDYGSSPFGVLLQKSLRLTVNARRSCREVVLPLIAGASVRFHEFKGAIMPQSIVITSAALATLQPAPITPGWVLDGAPDACNSVLAVSQDKTARLLAWECTPGLFNWNYTEDETVCILFGEVFITNNDEAERRLGTGDVAFFPAGSSCTWRVTETVRKVAFLRKDLPPLLGLGIRAWHKLLQKAGIRGSMPLG